MKVRTPESEVELREQFKVPIHVQDVELAFGGGDVKKLLPDYSKVPQDFVDGNAWTNEVDRWFFHGLHKDHVRTLKAGVDPNAAMRHLQAVIRSWQPKHEHKTAGVAFLLSLWFTRFGDASHP